MKRGWYIIHRDTNWLGVGGRLRLGLEDRIGIAMVVERVVGVVLFKWGDSSTKMVVGGWAVSRWSDKDFSQHGKFQNCHFCKRILTSFDTDNQAELQSDLIQY